MATEMDHGALWAQIRLMTKMRLGTDMSTLLREEDALRFAIRYPRRRVFIIRLNGRDLYDLTAGHVARPSMEWATDGEERDVHVEDLNAALLRLAGLEG